MMTQTEYGQIYQKGFASTVRLLRCRGASLDQAEDLAQAAWLQGWRKLDQLRDKERLVSWIYTIALNYHRRNGPNEARYQELSGFELSTGLGIESAPLDIAKILTICRPKDRRLFEHHLAGLTAREAAEKQGVSETAIRIGLLRARRNVRATLERRQQPMLPPPPCQLVAAGA
jgi:RNA polymerase sigma factor (sigma-70 family)